VSVFRFARGNEERMLGNAVPEAQAFRRESRGACCENATLPVPARRRRSHHARSISSSFPRARGRRALPATPPPSLAMASLPARAYPCHRPIYDGPP
jgi:hypothetical protein